jgi:protein SCO1/2
MRSIFEGAAMSRVYQAAALGAMAALLGGTLYLVTAREGNNGDVFAQCRSTAISGGAGAIGGPFTLVHEGGQRVSDADIITEPSLVYFGYTFCPDICPFDAARNADAVDLLAEKGISATPVFITIDPARDTPEVLAEFSAAMHPKMIGLTGSDEEVRAAAQTYRVYFGKREGEDPEFYLMEHTTFTYLALPGHGVVEFFRRETSAEDMAASAACFVKAAGI